MHVIGTYVHLYTLHWDTNSHATRKLIHVYMCMHMYMYLYIVLDDAQLHSLQLSHSVSEHPQLRVVQIVHHGVL